MKLIQAMKQIKDLQRKADDLRGRVRQNAAHLSIETPLYGDKQRETVREWLQGLTDISQEIARLRVAIQRTNLNTMVTMEIGGKKVEKCIAEWVVRRRELAAKDAETWQMLGDRGLKEGVVQNSQGVQVEVKIVRNFDPAERDRMMEMYRSEPYVIDSTLEVVNAVTDLVE